MRGCQLFESNFKGTLFYSMLHCHSPFPCYYIPFASYCITTPGTKTISEILALVQKQWCSTSRLNQMQNQQLPPRQAHNILTLGKSCPWAPRSQTCNTWGWNQQMTKYLGWDSNCCGTRDLGKNCRTMTEFWEQLALTNVSSLEARS